MAWYLLRLSQGFDDGVLLSQRGFHRAVHVGFITLKGPATNSPSALVAAHGASGFLFVLLALLQLAAHLTEALVAHELLLLLVPESEGEGLEAREERQRLHLAEKRVRVVAALQIVVRNA